MTTPHEHKTYRRSDGHAWFDCVAPQMYRLRIPAALYRRFADKAGSRVEEQSILVRLITQYVDGESPASQFAAAGGRARQQTMTKAQRSEAGRNAVATRWAKVRKSTKDLGNE